MSNIEKDIAAAYFRGYRQGACSNTRTAVDLPANIEIWDCATVNLVEWLVNNTRSDGNLKLRGPKE